MYRSILVPLDSSRVAEWALPAAMRIACRQGATLELLSIVRPSPDLDEVQRELAAAEFVTGGEGELLSYLGDVRAHIRMDSACTVEVSIREGGDAIGDLIVQHAREKGSDLIVMATHGYGGFKRFWLGSVADNVVRHGGIPTLLIRPAEDAGVDLHTRPRFQNILIPLDGSAAAESIIEHALAMGGEDAQYTLFEVAEGVSLLTPEYNLVAAQFDDGFRQTQQDVARATTTSAAERIRAHYPQYDVRTATVSGLSAASEILDYAAQNGIDLIAMSTRGRGGAARMILGSVADKVMRAALMPVLLYRPA